MDVLYLEFVISGQSSTKKSSVNTNTTVDSSVTFFYSTMCEGCAIIFHNYHKFDEKRLEYSVQT